MGQELRPRRILAWRLPAAGSEDHQRYAKRKGRWDEFKLWGLGYKQEFPRTFRFFNCFACGISVMSVYTTVESYSFQGLQYGGPVVVVWGWIAVGCLTLCIAASMGELLSAFPTSGGLYYWSWILAPPKLRGIMCWLTGFLNLLGQVAFTASSELLFTQVVCTLISMHTSQNGAPGYVVTPVQTMLIYIAATLSHVILNNISHSVTAFLLTFSAYWNLVAASVFMAVLLWVAPSHQPSSFVWLEWQPNSDVSGITSPVYIVLVGLLMSQWSMTGYDIIVNVCEETVDADVEAAWAIPASVLGTLTFGLGILLSMTYSLQSEVNLFDPETPTGSSAMAQVAWDVFAARYGDGRGSIPLTYIPMIGMFLCAYATVVSAGRMVFAFSRDGAMFGAKYWKQLNSNNLPVAGTWFMAVLSWLFGLPGCYNVILYNTISATSVVCLALSFGIPIGLSVWAGPRAFIRGPFNLGRWSGLIGTIAVAWTLASTAIFCLPSLYPLEFLTFNYTPGLLILVLLFAFASWWAPKYGACHWFTGPKPNVGIITEYKDMSQKPSQAVSDMQEPSPDVPLDMDKSVRPIVKDKSIRGGTIMSSHEDSSVRGGTLMTAHGDRFLLTTMPTDMDPSERMTYLQQFQHNDMSAPGQPMQKTISQRLVAAAMPFSSWGGRGGQEKDETSVRGGMAGLARALGFKTVDELPDAEGVIMQTAAEESLLHQEAAAVGEREGPAPSPFLRASGPGTQVRASRAAKWSSAAWFSQQGDVPGEHESMATLVAAAVRGQQQHEVTVLLAPPGAGEYTREGPHSTYTSLLEGHAVRGSAHPGLINHTQGAASAAVQRQARRLSIQLVTTSAFGDPTNAHARRAARPGTEHGAYSSGAPRSTQRMEGVSVASASAVMQELIMDTIGARQATGTTDRAVRMSSPGSVSGYGTSISGNRPCVPSRMRVSPTGTSLPQRTAPASPQQEPVPPPRVSQIGAQQDCTPRSSADAQRSRRLSLLQPVRRSFFNYLGSSLNGRSHTEVAGGDDGWAGASAGIWEVANSPRTSHCR